MGWSWWTADDSRTKTEELKFSAPNKGRIGLNGKGEGWMTLEIQGEKLVNNKDSSIFATLDGEENLEWSDGSTSDFGIQCVDVITPAPVDIIEPEKPDTPVQPEDPLPEQPEDPVPEQPEDPLPEQPEDPVPEKPEDPVPEQPEDPLPVEPEDPVPVEPTVHEVPVIIKPKPVGLPSLGSPPCALTFDRLKGKTGWSWHTVDPLETLTELFSFSTKTRRNHINFKGTITG